MKKIKKGCKKWPVINTRHCPKKKKIKRERERERERESNLKEYGKKLYKIGLKKTRKERRKRI